MGKIWGKFSNTQRVIMIGIIILLVVVIILRANVSRLRGPYCRFEDAINAGNVKVAVDSYKKLGGAANKKDRVNAEKMGSKYARIEISNYISGEESYEKVSEEISMLQESVLKNDSQVAEYVDKMEYWHNAEEMFRLGKEAKEAGLYEEAIDYFEQVPKDYVAYDEAQVAIEESEELIEARAKQIIEQAMATINIKEDLHTYMDAIKILDDYMAEYPEDNFIAARREQFMDEYYNIQLKNVTAMAESGDTESALKLAKELQSLNPERKEAQDYVKQLQDQISETQN